MRVIIVIVNDHLRAVILRPRHRKVRVVGTPRCSTHSNVRVSDM